MTSGHDNFVATADAAPQENQLIRRKAYRLRRSIVALQKHQQANTPAIVRRYPMPVLLILIPNP